MMRSAAVLPLVRAWRLDRTFEYSIPEELAATIEIGSLVRIPLGARKVRGIVLGFSESDQELEAILSLVVHPPLAPAAVRDLLVWVAARYVAPLPTVFERVVPQRIRVKPGAPSSLSDGPVVERLLDYKQGAELASVISTGGTGVWCVRSSAGEDRARLIGELVACARRADGTAVVMVPEVHYGSQVLDGLQEMFPECLRLDSQQIEKDRAAAWLGMAAGHRLGAGGRGTVLVPSPELRLIIVDEEHHRTYKEDRAPRFDARRVAIERARRQSAICVLISVAPLLETGAAVASGAFRIVEPERVSDKSARPIIEIMSKPDDRQIAHDAHRRMHDCLISGGKIAVLAPQRGYARSLWCGACRRSVRCPICEAGLRLEAGGGRVRCPRCHWSAATPGTCPSCGAAEFRLVGAGSERLAEQLAAMFPRATVARVDQDTLESGELRASDPDIYLTTWIGTKPALRPDVSLVAVLDADAFIRMPDFRASENAYRALVEMAEWAGPSAQGGRLLIQTAEPSHHAIQAVVRADYNFFLHRELEQRRELGYPPFSELMKVRSSGTAGKEVIGQVAERCRELGAVVLGPITVGLPGSGEDPGAEVLVKHQNIEKVAECLRVILPKVPSGTRLRVDVDPR